MRADEVLTSFYIGVLCRIVEFHLEKKGGEYQRVGMLAKKKLQKSAQRSLHSMADK